MMRSEWYVPAVEHPDPDSYEHGLARALITGERAHEPRVRVRRGGHTGNVVSSRLEGKDGNLTRRHAPVLDLDVPHRLVPSTTRGHGHLYLDVDLSWFRYVVLLTALRFAGVIERGHFWWSLRRGQTFVRKPGIRKPVAEEPQKTSVLEHALSLVGKPVLIYAQPGKAMVRSQLVRVEPVGQQGVRLFTRHPANGRRAERVIYVRGAVRENGLAYGKLAAL